MTWWLLTVLFAGGFVVVGLFVLVIVTSDADRPWTWEDELDALEAQRQARRRAEDATDRWPRPVRRKE